ncbi:MAG: ABC transporter permease [Spirochaetota bacterium]|nr:ABC transporter permease [Spirochaetota bacterium]
MRRIIAMIRKEVQQIKSDKFMLRFLILAPLFQLILLGYTLTMETEHVKTLICDLDRTSISRQFVDRISNNDRFDILGSVDSYAEIETEIRKWNAVIGIYIPPGFSRDLGKTGRGNILAVLDSVNGNQALTAFGYLKQIAVESALELAPVHVREEYLSRGGNIRINTHYWYNPELKDRDYMIPGIVVLIVTIISLMLGSMSIVKEKESGTLEQLMVTPLGKIQLILGKQIPFLIYSFIELIIILKLADFVFNIHLAGSLLSLYFVILIYLFTTLGLGLFVSTISKTQQQALFLTWFFMVFMILLSGFFIPIENMPWALKLITFINPLRYMMTTVREIYLKATPLLFLMDQIIPLTLLALGIFTASVVKFQKKLS